MTKIQELFSNLVLDRLNIHTVEQGIKALDGKQSNLEAIHIYIEPPTAETYRKKKYFHVSRLSAPSWLDSWIYKNLVSDEEYEQYLKKYLPLKQELGYDDVGEYILERHYRKQAIKILSQKKKSFDLDEWTKPRYRLRYRRKTDIELKDGTELHFDFRTYAISLFILKQGQDRRILAIGGSGNSGSRQEYTLFAALFYALSKKQPISHYLVKYDSFNQYHFITTYKKPIITYTLGANYDLSWDLQKEMRKNSIWLDEALKKIP